MRDASNWQGTRGITLIELMVVLSVIAVLGLLVAPRFNEMIVVQRLRGISTQLNTDLQFARTEAVARGRAVRVNMGSNSTQTCYVIYMSAGNGVSRCDCTSGAGSACPSGAAWQEIRTVSVPRSSGVALSWPQTQDTAFAYDHVTGGLITIPSDAVSVPLVSVQIDARVDDDRRLRSTVNQAGRPSICSPNPQRMQGVAC
jgi:type IV fimbrial biogenesis protein FimT